MIQVFATASDNASVSIRLLNFIEISLSLTEIYAIKSTKGSELNILNI